MSQEGSGISIVIEKSSNRSLNKSKDTDVLEESSSNISQTQDSIGQIDTDISDEKKSVPQAVQLNFDHLRRIIYELGLIKLCWPEILHPKFEDRNNFPESYIVNDNKEKLVLLYAENFRLQFVNKYPTRKPLLLACENECGIQKMVCTTIRPTTLPYPELENWKDCARFFGDHLKFEPFEDYPTLLPRSLCSPHTVFLRQSGHSFELATALCSLLIGSGYDAYVVSGYAVKDVTQNIMCRIDSPFPSLMEEKEIETVEVVDEKYKLKPPRDLRSKFLLMMEQREIDKLNDEKEKAAEEERQRLTEEEKRPPDDLEGKRVHAWVLLLAGERDIEKHIFIEPSTGLFYEPSSELFCGIESVWNHQNYWVNKQDCSKGLGVLDYDLDNLDNWEHLLVGEPITRRKIKNKVLEEEETNDMYEEKHLDMPISWGMRISIPHDVLKRRFPAGVKKTFFKRTCVEQFAPYVSPDGLLTKITRYDDFECTEIKSVEEIYENRSDKQYRHFHDVKNGVYTDYFRPGREDGVVKYIYHDEQSENFSDRTIFFNSDARYDALSRIECTATELSQFFKNREDKLYYRKVVYAKNLTSSSDEVRTSNEKVIEKFERDETKNPNDDIAYREFCIADRKIYLKYHYGKDNVTASTRTFIKPSISEMGEEMIFKPELTYGYQAAMDTKPPSNLKLFILFEAQLKEEYRVLNSIRETEAQIKEFIRQRAYEQISTKLDISLYNKEQNVDFRMGMLEKEEQQRLYKVKEVEEEIDYLAPYLARAGNPSELSYQKALELKLACLDDFTKLLVQRAVKLQKIFEKASEELQRKKNWYPSNHDKLTQEEETSYFERVNADIFYLHTLEIRLTRHKDLSPLRYEALVKYLDNHPMLEVLSTSKYLGHYF